MRAAIIADGVVTNVIEVEALADWPGAIDAEGAGIGWTWDGTTLAPPPPPPPPPLVQSDQLAARVEFRARKLEKAGELLKAYALRNNL
jgi:hypothetical protein